MMNRTAVAVAALAAFGLGACDLPSSPEEARDRLGRGEGRTVSLTFPFPTVDINLGEQLSDSTGPFAGVLDPNDLSFSLDPDPVNVAIGGFVDFGAIDMDPITRSYDLAVDDYELQKDVEAQPFQITMPRDTTTGPLAPATSPDSVDLPAFDFSAIYQSISFADDGAPDAALTVVLTTDGASSLTNASVAVLDAGDGSIISESTGSITLGNSETDTLTVPVAGLSVAAAFQVRLRFDAANGTATDGNITVDVGFENPEAESATGVAVANVADATVDRTVPLDAATDFATAVMETGTIDIASWNFGGDLDFTPSSGFDTDLADKQIGGTDPDSIRIAGTIGPKSGLTRVDIQTSGTVTLALTNLSVAEITRSSLDFSFDQTLDAVDISSGEFEGVDEVVVDEGALEIEIANNLEVDGNITITLAGATIGGQPVSGSTVVPAASGGVTATATLVVDLSGATISPGDFGATASGSFTGTDITVTSAQAAEAAVFDPSLDVDPASITLSNAPGLDADFQELQNIAIDDLGLGGLTETLDSVELNDVQLLFRIDNPTGIDLSIDSLALALVNNADTSAVVDDDGSPIRLEVVDASSGFTVAANSSDSISVAAAPFINGLIQETIAGNDVGLLAGGRTDFGSVSGTIERGDTISFDFSISAPLDLQLPTGGVGFDETRHAFIDLDSLAANVVTDLGDALTSGEFSLAITNGTPVGLSVGIALAPTPADTAGFDPFAASQRFELLDIGMAPANVGSDGLVTSPSSGTATVTIPGQELSVFEQGELSLGIQIQITPPPSGRVRITSDDYIRVDPTATLEVRVGETGGQ